jgi:hypothetical protein
MNTSARPMTKEDDMIKKVIETYVNRNGYSEVRANIEGFESPSALSLKGSEEKLVPDITASKRGGKWYIELVRKEGDPEKTISKWKLLSILGKTKGGGLVLISPPGSFAFAERLTKKHDIPVQIVKF